MGMLRHHLILALLLGVGALTLRGNPTGGAVTSGSATIAGQGSSAVTIHQSSNTAIINWQSFSIGSGELTKFVQPSSNSAALNRVLGGQTSFIDGTLSANGKIFLLNGNGIIVGPGGIINTAGFTGSTREISDSDFLSGKLHFVGSSDAGISNLGNITALGGDVVLIGKTVDNGGTITASDTAGLIAGDDVMLAQKNTDGNTITVNPVSAASGASTKIGVNNSGSINASTAELKAANGNIYALAIQNSGVVRATTVTQQGGHIYLTSDSGTILNSGTLDASATAAKGHGGTVVLKSKTGNTSHSGKIVARGGQGGVGGNAEISGAQIGFTGTVDLTALGGTTGNLLLDPVTLNVVTGGTGTVNFGGGGAQNDPTSTTISPTQVEGALSSANLTLNADTNITVSNDVTWGSGNTLTLSTNNTGSTIRINAAITGTAGGLTIDTAGVADNITASGAINVSAFILSSGAWVQNVAPNAKTGASNLPGFTASNDFEINGGTFLRTSGGNGSSNTPYQLVDVYGLQGVNGFLNRDFNLGSRSNIYGVINASGTTNWNGGAGFVPLGSVTAPYTGTFTGGEIDGLTINLPNANNAVGLFAYTSAGAVIQNLTLNNSNITGNNVVGGIVGDNLGAVTNDEVNGGNITGVDQVGGYVGLNDASGSVVGGNSGTTVTGTADVGGVAGENEAIITGLTNYSAVTGDSQVGGITGLNDSTGTVSNSSFGVNFQNASVTGNNSQQENSFAVGGLIGENDGTLSNSFTDSSIMVTGYGDIGGLVGNNQGLITGSTTGNNFGGNNTYNGGTVTGTNDVGGVAGFNSGKIADTYNTGAVSGQDNVGGVAGENVSTGGEENSFRIQSESSVNSAAPGASAGLIETSYNSGTVSGDVAVGGIVGLNDSTGTVDTIYNVGAVEGDDGSDSVGGLVGDNYGTVQNGYNSGPVSGTTNVGALIGFDEDFASAANLYWDTTTSGSAGVATNNSGDENSASETNIATVDGSTAYTIAGNDPNSGAGYGFLGAATAVPNTNGVYEIGTSPDSDANGGPAWYIIEGQTRPILAMEANYNVQNAHQLQLIAINLGNGYNIGHTIDASGTANASEVWGPAGFNPLGSNPSGEGVAFTGSINGEYNAVSDLFINRPTTDDVGLVGYAGANSNIVYVILQDANITGHSNVGGVVGNNSGTVSYAQDNATTFSNQPVFNVRGNGNDVGGIVGLNQPTGFVGEDINNAMIVGATGSTGIGGIAGGNLRSGSQVGQVTQSINSGVVGSGVETAVGGLVGDNSGQVDDSYATTASMIDGLSDVGGLVGHNEATGIFETSYSQSTVTGVTAPTAGALVGTNDGIARHAYWDTDNSALPGIGTNNNLAGTTDVVGYTTAQLTDIHNYAQGKAPVLWDFSPDQGSGEGETHGVWGINVYGAYIGSPTNGGLPVLQWQTPVSTEVAVTSGNQTYGDSNPISIVVTGNGASTLNTEVPGGPTVTVSNPDDFNAGTTHTVTLSGTPTDYGYNVEYVNGVVDIVQRPLTITANSFTLPVGQPVPTLTATFAGFAPGEGPTNLGGPVTFTVTPQPADAAGIHTITPGGDFTDTNYTYTFVNGRLTFTTTSAGENQQVATVESELTSSIDRFGFDPFNGLDPLYFMVLPTHVGLEGDFLGAINNEPNAGDFAFASSTSGLPAVSRLVTPGSGVVAIGNGYVVVGCPDSGAAVYLNGSGVKCLPESALGSLRSVLSPSVYQQLVALIYAHR